jgi:hypothetical protein
MYYRKTSYKYILFPTSRAVGERRIRRDPSQTPGEKSHNHCINNLFGRLRRGGSTLPEEGEYLYPFGVETKAALILRGGGMYELGALLFRADHSDTDLLMIEPSPAESSLFLYGSMNFAEFDPGRQRSAAPAR